MKTAQKNDGISLTTTEQFSKRIDKICQALTREIPKPYKAPARPQKSWKTLKIGQRIRMLKPLSTSGRIGISTGLLMEVTAADSQGVWLTPISEPVNMVVSGVPVRFEDQDWKLQFEKVKKTKKTAKKGTEQNSLW